MSYGTNGSVIGPDNLPTASTATGIWSLGEIAEARRDGIWPEPLGTHWIGMWTPPANKSINSVYFTLDWQDNMTLTMQQYDSSTTASDVPAIHTDSNGAVQWQKNYGINSATGNYGIQKPMVRATNSRDITFAADGSGYWPTLGLGTVNPGVIWELDEADGSVNWAKTIYKNQAYISTAVGNCVPNGGTYSFFSMAADNAQACYIITTTTGVGYSQWVGNGGSWGGAWQPYGVTSPGNGNMYMAFQGYHGSYGVTPWLFKITGAGTLANQAYMTNYANMSGIWYDCTTDSSENVYACGYHYNNVGTAIDAGLIAKYNSGLSQQAYAWSRPASPTASSCYWQGITCDTTTDDIYVAGHCKISDSDNTVRPTIAKYNSSLVRQWIRYFDVSPSTNPYGYSSCKPYIDQDSPRNLWVSFEQAITPNGGGTDLQVPCVAKLPTDGSGTGSTTVGHVTVTYADASSYVDETGHTMYSGYSGVSNGSAFNTGPSNYSDHTNVAGSYTGPAQGNV